MTLDSIYMPLPAGTEGQRVAPLGDWPDTAPVTAEEIRENAKARWRRYADKNRAKRIQAMRDWRARRKA